MITMGEEKTNKHKKEINRLFRSNDDKVFAGILAGVGKYFNVDPVILRVVWLLVTVFSGFLPGILVYIFATFIIPKEKK